MVNWWLVLINMVLGYCFFRLIEFGIVYRKDIFKPFALNCTEVKT